MAAIIRTLSSGPFFHYRTLQRRHNSRILGCSGVMHLPSHSYSQGRNYAILGVPPFLASVPPGQDPRLAQRDRYRRAQSDQALETQAICAPEAHWPRTRFDALFQRRCVHAMTVRAVLETIRVRGRGSFNVFDMSMLVTQISGAIGAAARGKMYYFGGGLARKELQNNNHEEWMCPNFGDPVETEQLRGLIPGKKDSRVQVHAPAKGQQGRPLGDGDQ